METKFSKQDISTFRKALASFSDKREQYGAELTLYDMFLISVFAVNWYPAEHKMTVASYHEDDTQKYAERFLDRDYPMAYETFSELTRPMIGDEGKKKHRWMRDSFVPRCFWDELYASSK